MRKILLIVIFTGLVIIISCSKTSNPVMIPNMENPDTGYNLPDISEGVSADRNLGSNKGVFGAWKIRVDSETLQAEIIPARNAHAIGDIFDSDLSQFLNISPCGNCLIIPQITWDGYQNLAMKVGMKHPFDNIAARPDLHGFDVRAIFILPHKFSETFTDIKVINTDGVEEDANLDMQWSGLLSPDGFTSHYDWLTTDTRYFITGNDLPGNLNPFIRFFENYNTAPFDPHAPAGHNVMAVGSGYYQRTAILDGEFLENPDFEFYIIADVAYGQSATFANRPDPQYYLPAFNRTEAWRIEYWIENNNLTFMDPSSTADLVVQVFDWQQNAVVDPSYPDPLNLNGVSESSRVHQLELSIPGFQLAPIVTDVNEGGDGSPDNPLQYRLQVTNEQGMSGNSYGLLAVRDELNGSPSPMGRMPIPDIPAGFPYETKDILDYSYYMLVNVNLRNGFYMHISTADIDGELFYSTRDQLAKWNETSIAPDFFMDPGHRKFLYNWDYDYDGITFNVDGSGLPSPTITFPGPGRYNTGLRVRTNSKPPREYTYEIPAWSTGEVFQNSLPTLGTLTDATSSSRNHSAAIANDKFYLTFVHYEAGQQDIMLGILERDGDMSITHVTDNTNICNSPSLTVVEEGPDAGVYVVYSQIEGLGSFVYVDNGDLNGIGFNTGNAKRISSGPSSFEYSPIIVDHSGALHVYYQKQIVVDGKIYGANSPDYNQSWASTGWIVDNGSMYQLQPCFAYSGAFVYLIWVDWINGTNSGYDLYMAGSLDGENFSNIENISTTPGMVHDYAPSAAYHRGRIPVAYLSWTSSSERNVKVTIVNLNQSSKTEIMIDPGETDKTHSFPAIGCSSDSRFIVMYGEKNTTANRMYLYCKEYVFSDGSMSQYIPYNGVSMGVVDAVLFEIFPVIASQTPSNFVVENLFAWTDFTDGETGSPSNFYGDVKTAYFITERTWYD